MALNSFNQGTATYGEAVTSTVDSSALVTAIQAAGPDGYFDATSKIGAVHVRYTHEDGRQRKVLFHNGTALTGDISWSSFARDGTWEKDLVETWNHDGAKSTLLRPDIGSSEDIVMTDGTMALNA